MGSIITFPIKHLTHTFIFLLPYFLCAYCPNNSIISPPISPPLHIPPIPKFLDHRLREVYPIIQAFKNLITSDPFNVTSSWVGSDICNYTGFYCAHPPNNQSATALASIDFNGFGLVAPTLDGFINQLPDIAIFHANSNKFSGTIPPKLATLPFLYELDLSDNNFSGAFPLHILHMNRLSFLDIRYNFFTGSVPPQLFLKNLDVLFLNNNKFTLKLPENLGSTPALYLTLANNKFTGSIPRSIGKASSTLTEVLLLNNWLSGCLPYELGFLKELKVFDASNNHLTGPLPISLGCLEKLEQLNLSRNLLYGKVPEVLCALGNLVKLSLSNNYFTKVGTLCGKLIESGVLEVKNNCIRDLPDQRSKVECIMFFSDTRSCPRPSTFDIIPCNVTPTSNNPPARPKRISLAYTAFVRHRLL
ncbi:uncharacterized protein At4g06744-like [Pistacia vera]|uniref:uncharacterized protein At4g06744-like n=1 Tax=Pistacia vera TaxID=55513 RepID=UPI00126380B7|nr:uncharacterized protein At4g06744-like [Pistacia vera]